MSYSVNLEQQKRILQQSSNNIGESFPAPINGISSNLVQRAQDTPERLSSQDVLELQRTIGNRQVVQLLAPHTAPKSPVIPLKHGPSGQVQRTSQSTVRSTVTPADGMPEQEADRIAAQVTGQTAPVQRSSAPTTVGMEGGPLSQDTEQTLRQAKGGGRGLDQGVRRQMESSFGTSFDGVRIHTDNRADRLNRSLQAKAFTTGQDIFFSRNQYQPNSSGGKQLLAHELTHTIQQGAVKQNQIQPSRDQDSDAESGVAEKPSSNRTAPIPVQRTAKPVIQRFVTREMMIKLAGAPSKRATRKESTYVQILGLLDTYQEAQNQKEVLREIVRLSQEWIDNHGTSGIRSSFIQGLRSEAQARMHVRTQSKLEETIKTTPFAPSLTATKQAERESTAANPDWVNPKLANTPADKHVFTIAVAVEFDEQIKFALARAKSMVRNKIRGGLTKIPLFGIRGSKKQGKGKEVIKRGLFKLAAPKSGGEVKKKAARQVLEQKGEKNIDEKMIIDTAARSTEVGHTWVKFKKMVGSEVKEIYSYGMWPENGYGHPAKPVPGMIRHPDIVHENVKGEKQLSLNSEVPAKNFDDGLQLAIERLKQKPNYILSGYNCTGFAKEIASKVGVSFPQAATVFPAGPSKGFRQGILNPNRLYESMEEMQKGGDKSVTGDSFDYEDYDEEKRLEEERQEHEAQEQMERKLDSLAQYDVSSASPFWPGASFGNEEPILFDPYEYLKNKVWSTGTTAQYMDPDLSAMMDYTKVKVPMDGKLVVGWIRSDDIERAY